MVAIRERMCARRMASASLPALTSPLQDKPSAAESGGEGAAALPAERLVASGCEPSARQAKRNGKRRCGGGSLYLPSVTSPAVASRPRPPRKRNAPPQSRLATMKVGFGTNKTVRWGTMQVKSSQVHTLPKAKGKTRSKQNKDMHKCSSVYSERGVLFSVLTSGGK